MFGRRVLEAEGSGRGGGGWGVEWGVAAADGGAILSSSAAYTGGE